MATPQNAHHVCPSWRYGSNAGISKAASTIAGEQRCRRAAGWVRAQRLNRSDS